MSSNELASPYRRLPGSTVAIVVASAFAIGALTGAGFQGAVDRASQPASLPEVSVPAQEFKGVADNNTSDAADAAQNGDASLMPIVKGVADNNMSDAARRATYAGARPRNATPKAGR